MLMWDFEFWVVKLHEPNKYTAKSWIWIKMGGDKQNKKYERDAKLAFASMVGIGVSILIAILVEIITK